MHDGAHEPRAGRGRVHLVAAPLRRRRWARVGRALRGQPHHARTRPLDDTGPRHDPRDVPRDRHRGARDACGDAGTGRRRGRVLRRRVPLEGLGPDPPPDRGPARALSHPSPPGAAGATRPVAMARRRARDARGRARRRGPRLHARRGGHGVDDVRLSLRGAPAVGDGRGAAGATEHEIDRLRLAPHVTLAGAVEHGRIPELLADAQLYVQHCMSGPDGDQEGQGISFVEAGASGLPVVTTDHPGIRDVVEHGVTGLLSPEGDVEAMGENLARLALDPASWSALGTQGRALAVERFSLQATVAGLTSALRGCASER